MYHYGLLAFVVFAGQCVKVLALTTGSRGDVRPELGQQPYPRRLAVVFLNDDRAILKRRCMESQMQILKDEAEALGLTLNVERFPTVVFQDCQDEAACIAEHPECLYTGRLSYVEPERMRQVAGHFCTHMDALGKLGNRSRDHDFFLVLEDDVLLLPGALSKILEVFKAPAYWDVVTLDNFQMGPSADRILNDANLELYSVPASLGVYSGAHAWLVNAGRIERLLSLYRNMPVVPNDVVLRAPRPLHFGVWSFVTGYIRHARDLMAVPEEQLTFVCKVWAAADLGRPPMPLEILRQQASALSFPLTPPVSQARLEPTTPQRENPREVVVFGMYSSGTKMLSDLIRMNLEEPHNVTLCVNYTNRGYCGGIWKHHNPSRAADFTQLRSTASGPLSEAVAVVVVRHPFSVVRSLTRHSYDMTCAGGNLNSTLDMKRSAGLAMEPCEYTPDPALRALHEPDTVRLPNATCEGSHAGNGKQVCWPSLPEAWNSYAKGYFAMAKTDVFHKTLILRYEDVVEFPEAAARQIAQAVGLPEPDHVSYVEKMLGRQGWGFAGRDESLVRLRTWDYTTNFTCAEARAICSGLDASMMHKLGYHGCQSTWPGWRRLIFGGRKARRWKLTKRRSQRTEEFWTWCRAHPAI